ncbi:MULTISPECIES: carboxypeptidase-like regulatory domain-containing protein [Flavobacterium]|uniref:Carboxypeptidase regulatory-like domain-containing protein n=1 Tax=Flavobacterium hankyongi TaxID=1176532 RepID=A0ABP9A027_9FLAO|nr:carboxypeptidase-like regulatory domain-containing protein [Flavobacterium sp. N1846]
MKKILFLVLLILGITNGYSQIITGIIHDSSKKPLSGVIITEKDVINNCVSDKDGKFSIAINNLVDNKYMLGISLDGYYYSEASGFGNETKLDIEMIRIGEDLEGDWKKISPEEKDKQKN